MQTHKPKSDLKPCKNAQELFDMYYPDIRAAFLESALKTFDYTRFTKDVTRGTIRMKAYRRKS